MERVGDWIWRKANSLRKRRISITLSGRKFPCRTTNSAETNKEKFLLENGSKLLEELIISCNGRSNPIRIFSAEDLRKATDNFQKHCYSNDSDWYNGVLDDRLVLIRRHKKEPYAQTYEKPYTGPFRDIAISSQMSSHNNVLKLLGCCLEFNDPFLVYENAENGCLNACGGIGSNGSSLSWKVRLKIAIEIANALTYLHTKFSRPIIHMSIKPENIFLDKDFVAKLSDFACSVSIPEGKLFVGTYVFGSWQPAFVDPVSLIEGNVAEQSDVYSFGVFLLVLITGRNAYNRHEKHKCNYVKDLFKEERFNEIVDPKILEEGRGITQQHQLQLQAFVKLALSCIEYEREDRPLMIDVAKELRRIERSTSFTLACTS